MPGICCSRQSPGCCPLGAQCVRCAARFVCSNSAFVTKRDRCNMCAQRADTPPDCMGSANGSVGAIIFLGLLVVLCFCCFFMQNNNVRRGGSDRPHTRAAWPTHIITPCHALPAHMRGPPYHPPCAYPLPSSLLAIYLGGGVTARVQRARYPAAPGYPATYGQPMMSPPVYAGGYGGWGGGGSGFATGAATGFVGGMMMNEMMDHGGHHGGGGFEGGGGGDAGFEADMVECLLPWSVGMRTTAPRKRLDLILLASLTSRTRSEL
eukprot:scaffold131507_cov33-Tisochrysis_lutea.AAC.2